MIYTRFGTPCDIVAAWPARPDGAIPVDLICHDQDGKDREFKTYVHELIADGGIAEIDAAIAKASLGSVEDR